MDRCKNTELCSKEVINICDGRRLGCVIDIEITICDGKICAVVVPGETNFIGMSKHGDIVIPWEKIERIGEDIILVNLPAVPGACCEPKPKKKFFF